MVRLFWPKEIKELVKKYEAEGTLNQNAISYLTHQTYVVYAVAFVFICILLYENYLFIPLVVALGPFIVWFDLKLCFHRNLAAYTNGERRKVEVIKPTQSLYPMQWIYYNDKDAEGEIAIGGRPMIVEEQLPRKGDEIFIYQDAYKKHLAMPDIDYIKQVYSLTTKVL